MQIGGIIYIILLALFVFHAEKKAECVKPSAQPLNPAQIEKLCREIGKAQQRLDELNRMLIDIDICQPDELIKNFRFVWESGGVNRKYDFYIDGASPTSEDMRRMITAERERLRTSLLEMVDELCRLRCNANVTQTIDHIAGEGTEDAW